MDLNTFQALTEAYSAVYNDELRAELLSIEEDFSMIDNFSDEELVDVMEDIFRNNEFQIQECFDILSEATVTYGQGSRMAASSRLVGMKQKKRESRIGRIKQAATSAVDRIKKAPSAARKYVSGKISSAREKIAGALRSAAQKVDTKPKSKETSERTPSTYRGAGVGTKERVSSGSYSAPSKKKPASTSGKIEDPWGGSTSPKAKTPKATTKKTRFGNKKNIKSSGEAAYQAAKAKMTEDISVYDIVLEHLISEGYAESVESAEKIMVNMSEEWREEIVEAYVDYRKGKLPSGRTPQQKLTNKLERTKVAASREQRDGGSFGPTATPSWKRSKKSGAVGDEMDANTSFGGKVNKVVNLGRRDNAGPSVQRGEPNTARHQQAIDAREKAKRS